MRDKEQVEENHTRHISHTVLCSCRDTRLDHRMLHEERSDHKSVRQERRGGRPRRMGILKGDPCGNMPRATFERLERQ